MKGNVDWRGEEVVRKVVAAAKVGIDETMAECVTYAKRNHEWNNITGTAEGSIRMDPAQPEGFVVRGRWGSFDVNYFIFLELGTQKMRARPILRPTADLLYPSLRPRMKALFKAM